MSSLGERFLNACEYGNLEEVKRLLETRGIEAGINYPTQAGSTPFGMACSRGHGQIAWILQHHPKVNVNHQSDAGCTGFYYACWKGHLEIVRNLANDPRVDINLVNQYQVTPFCIACSIGHSHIVKYLLAIERFVDINKPNKIGTSPLAGAKWRITSTKKFSWETEEQFQYSKRSCPFVVSILEQYNRDPYNTKNQFRREFGLGKLFFFFHFFFFFFILNTLFSSLIFL